MGECSNYQCPTYVLVLNFRTAQKVRSHYDISTYEISHTGVKKAIKFMLVSAEQINVFAANPGLLIGPQNSLLCFDARTGLQKWATAFDVPLVAAYPSGGGQNILSGVQLLRY